MLTWFYLGEIKQSSEGYKRVNNKKWKQNTILSMGGLKDIKLELTGWDVRHKGGKGRKIQAKGTA